MRRIVITTILRLVSVLICAYHPHQGEVNETALPTRSPAKRSFTFPTVNQYAQAPMHPSSMPDRDAQGIFSSQGAECESERSEVEGLTSSGAAVMAPTPPPGVQGRMTGLRQLPPMSDDPLLAK